MLQYLKIHPSTESFIIFLDFGISMLTHTKSDNFSKLAKQFVKCSEDSVFFCFFLFFFFFWSRTTGRIEVPRETIIFDDDIRNVV